MKELLNCNQTFSIDLKASKDAEILRDKTLDDKLKLLYIHNHKL